MSTNQFGHGGIHVSRCACAHFFEHGFDLRKSPHTSAITVLHAIGGQAAGRRTQERIHFAADFTFGAHGVGQRDYIGANADILPAFRGCLYGFQSAFQPSLNIGQ